MRVEPFDILPDKKAAGRPVKYPFNELVKAGLKLIIPHGEKEVEETGKSIDQQQKIIQVAVNQYSRTKDPGMKASVFVEGNEIVVYRTI